MVIVYVQVIERVREGGYYYDFSGVFVDQVCGFIGLEIRIWCLMWVKDCVGGSFIRGRLLWSFGVGVCIT